MDSNRFYKLINSNYRMRVGLYGIGYFEYDQRTKGSTWDDYLEGAERKYIGRELCIQSTGNVLFVQVVNVYFKKENDILHMIKEYTRNFTIKLT